MTVIDSWAQARKNLILTVYSCQSLFLSISKKLGLQYLSKQIPYTDAWSETAVRHITKQNRSRARDLSQWRAGNGEELEPLNVTGEVANTQQFIKQLFW